MFQKHKEDLRGLQDETTSLHFDEEFGLKQDGHAIPNEEEHNLVSVDQISRSYCTTTTNWFPWSLIDETTSTIKH